MLQGSKLKTPLNPQRFIRDDLEFHLQNKHEKEAWVDANNGKEQVRL
jgi:hypothetical protein